MTYILTIENIESDKSYLVLSHDSNAETMIRDALKQGMFPSKELQSEWTRFGEEAFEIGIVEEVSDDMTDAKMDEWLNILESVTNLGWL